MTAGFVTTKINRQNQCPCEENNIKLQANNCMDVRLHLAAQAFLLQRLET